MPLNRTQKKELTDEYKGIIDQSAGFVIFEYRGITVEEVTNLRNKIREAGGVTRVVKNRMLKRAIEDRPYPELNEHLTGPNAIIFSGDDPVAPVKNLMDFVKEHENLKIKAGVVNDTFLDAAQVEQLSKIPPKDQLYAKILGGIKAPASNILGCVKGAHQKLHGLIKALAEKIEDAA